LLVADQRIAGVVVDGDDKPVAGAWMYAYGDKQSGQNRQSDSKGRFSFDKICAGTVRLSVNSQRGGFANIDAQAGDTNITAKIGSSPGNRRAEAARRSLKGKTLPDLAPLGFSTADAPEGKPILALLMDAEQRPSRRALHAIAEQAPALKEKGVSVLVIHLGPMAEDAFNDWKKAAAVPFPIGTLKVDPDKARAAWGATALPWLILADKTRHVAAEGFPADELEIRLAELGD
jgi:hypothetical protein